MKKLILIGLTGLFLASFIACGSSEPEVIEIIKEVPVEKIVTEQVIVEKEVPVEKIVVEEKIITKEGETKTIEVVKVIEREVEVEKVVTVNTRQKNVPRNRTVKVSGLPADDTAYDIWSMYAIGGTHQKGVGLFYEPLYYYDGFDDIWYPWLAESYSYSDDLLSLTYNLRDGIEWSDGTPFTAGDVAYTFNTLADYGAEVRYGAEFERFLDIAEAVDDRTVVINFTQPAPKFHSFLTYKGDSGIFIVPEHIFSQHEWPEFKHFDLDKGWPITTSPWRVSFADPNQRIIDRVLSCDEWWACKTGFQELPKVERFINLPSTNQSVWTQQIITGEIDSTGDLQAEQFKTAQAASENVVSWSGNGSSDPGPFGHASWWPTSIVTNNLDPHLSKRDVRWALSYYLDREQVIDVSFSGHGTLSAYPWPPFGGFDDVEAALADTYTANPTNAFDSAKADSLMTGEGYTKNSDGYWANADGVVTCDILGYGIFSDQGPVLAAQLEKGGVKSSYAEPVDAYALMTSGKTVADGGYTCSIFGHNGAQGGDPYLTLLLYYTGNEGNFYNYSNPEFDKLVDELALIDSDDRAEIIRVSTAAMEIWMKDLPDIQIVQFLTRPAMSTKYWTNWPQGSNGYMNGLFTHLGFHVTLQNLEPVE